MRLCSYGIFYLYFPAQRSECFKQKWNEEFDDLLFCKARPCRTHYALDGATFRVIQQHHQHLLEKVGILQLIDIDNYIRHIININLLGVELILPSFLHTFLDLINFLSFDAQLWHLEYEVRLCGDGT